MNRQDAVNKIVTLTMNPSVDKSSEVEQVVSEDKLHCSRPGYAPGGGGLNVSRALKRLGRGSIALHALGKGPGTMLADMLSEEGIVHHPTSVGGLTRENLSVYEKSSGRQYRFDMPGPELSGKEVEECLKELEKHMPEAEYVVASGSLPPGVPDNFYARIASLCVEQGVRCIVDSSGPPLLEALEQGVFMAKPNLRELHDLCGLDFDNHEKAEEMGRSLLESDKAEVLAVSLGSQGAVLITEKETRRVSSPTVPVRSKVGAGDSMLAGMVAKLSEGADMLDALHYGVAAGAAAVMTPGSELCRKEDVERLYLKIKEDG